MSEYRKVKIDNQVSVEINSDVTKVALVILLCCIAMNTCGSYMEQQRSNELRVRQLEHAQKQYVLDSLRYYSAPKQR